MLVNNLSLTGGNRADSNFATAYNSFVQQSLSNVGTILKVKPSAMLASFQSHLSTGSLRENDHRIITSIGSLRDNNPNARVLFTADGTSLPLNPPNYGCPWLTAFASKSFPSVNIISSDLSPNTPNFFLLMSKDHLLAYGSFGLDFKNPQIVRSVNGEIETETLDSQNLKHAKEEDMLDLDYFGYQLGESKEWQRYQAASLKKQDFFTFKRGDKKSEKLFTFFESAMEFGKLDEVVDRVIFVGAKDPVWEAKIFGIHSVPEVDVTRLDQFKGVKDLSFVVARHITPEVLHGIASDLQPFDRVLPDGCVVDMSTEDVVNRHASRSIPWKFSITGKKGDLSIFSVS